MSCGRQGGGRARHPFAHEVIGILEFAVRRIIVVVALRVHDTNAGAKAAAVALFRFKVGVIPVIVGCGIAGLVIAQMLNP